MRKIGSYRSSRLLQKAHIPQLVSERFPAAFPEKSTIKITIFPTGKLRRPKKKLETIKRFWRGDGTEY
jgi:hypothetical protein